MECLVHVPACYLFWTIYIALTSVDNYCAQEISKNLLDVPELGDSLLSQTFDAYYVQLFVRTFSGFVAYYWMSNLN